MGVFMASVAFQAPRQEEWTVIKPRIEALFKGLEGLTDNLNAASSGYAIVSPYGDMAMLLAELPAKISAMTGGFAVFANCCDSDFSLLELYHKGALVEKSCIGELYEEFEDFEDAAAPSVDHWLPLLQPGFDEQMLKSAFDEDFVFAEDNLRLLSKVTGLPIFDDELVFGEA